MSVYINNDALDFRFDHRSAMLGAHNQADLVPPSIILPWPLDWEVLGLLGPLCHR